MKNVKYFALCFVAFIIVSSCTGADGDNQKLRWIGQTDVSDFTIYRGSATGAKIVPLEDNDARRDSVRSYLAPAYVSSLFASFMIEFKDEFVTYTDSAYARKVLSTYEFKQDSLFVNLTDGSQQFVAQGDMDSLYRIQSIVKYENPESGKDTLYVHDKILDLDLVLKLAGYTNEADMTDSKKAIMWCNVKYIFKK